MAEDSFVSQVALGNTIAWASSRRVALINFSRFVIRYPVGIVWIDDTTPRAVGICRAGCALLFALNQRVGVADTEVAPENVRMIWSLLVAFLYFTNLALSKREV